MVKTAVIELLYNMLSNQINQAQRQNNLTNAEMQAIIERILNDFKSVRLIESADEILKLSQKIEALEKKEAGNDQSNAES